MHPTIQLPIQPDLSGEEILQHFEEGIAIDRGQLSHALTLQTSNLHLTEDT
jgi:hypothetical protein